MKNTLFLIGYGFIAVVSVVSAMAVDNNILRGLLCVSAMISLIIAVFGIMDAKKTKQEIDYLKENQLSVSIEDETLVINQGL